MSILSLFKRLFTPQPKQSTQNIEKRYDHVTITNAVDGSTIQGHEAVKTYFEREKKMLEEHGASITFQIYRMNLQAHTLQELQGEKILDIKVDGKFISGDDTVALVKENLRSLLEQNAQDVTIDEVDRITFFFNGRPMRDRTGFYADNFVMLPAWVQVFLHRCGFEELAQIITTLQNNDQHRPTQ